MRVDSSMNRHQFPTLQWWAWRSQLEIPPKSKVSQDFCLRLSEQVKISGMRQNPPSQVVEILRTFLSPELLPGNEAPYFYSKLH